MVLYILLVEMYYEFCFFFDERYTVYMNNNNKYLFIWIYGKPRICTHRWTGIDTGRTRRRAVSDASKDAVNVMIKQQQKRWLVRLKNVVTN